MPASSTPFQHNRLYARTERSPYAVGYSGPSPEINTQTSAIRVLLSIRIFHIYCLCGIQSTSLSSRPGVIRRWRTCPVRPSTHGEPHLADAPAAWRWDVRDTGGVRRCIAVFRWQRCGGGGGGCDEAGDESRELHLSCLVVMSFSLMLILGYLEVLQYGGSVEIEAIERIRAQVQLGGRSYSRRPVAFNVLIAYQL